MLIKNNRSTCWMCPGRYQGQHLVHRVLLNLGVCGPGLSENRRPVSSHLGFSVNTFRDYTDGVRGRESLVSSSLISFSPGISLQLTSNCKEELGLLCKLSFKASPPPPLLATLSPSQWGWSGPRCQEADFTALGGMQTWLLVWEPYLTMM